MGLAPTELIILGIVAVLLFGKRLPDVAKSIGASYQQFRAGLTDIQRQMDVKSYTNYSSSPKYDSDEEEISSGDYDEPSSPKFELPTENSSSED